MALRFLLVSLVAGMGLELPSSQELSNWTKAGREWAEARVVAFSSLRGEAEMAFLGATDCERDVENTGTVATATPEAGSSTADLAFDVVVEGMASTFAADLAAIRSHRLEETITPETVAEQPRGEDSTIVAVSDIELEPVCLDESVETPVREAVNSIPTVSARGDRLSTAVRLTRQAVTAWASLIEGTSEISTDSQ